MSTDPTISIVIPAHNARRTIGIALSSLVLQTFEDWEAIIVDDGSTDGTLDVARAIDDSRFRLFTQVKSGAAAARNKGLEMAQGKFIGFLDADDFIFPEYLEASLEILSSSNQRTIVTHNAYFLNAGGLSSRQVRHRHSLPRTLSLQQSELLRSNFVSIMSVFSRELLDGVGMFDSSLERAEDWDFWIRASFAGWRFAHQKRPMAIINRTGESLSSAVDKVARCEAEILRTVATTQVLSRRQSARIAKRLQVGEPSALWADSDKALESRDYARAASLHLTATLMTTRSPSSLVKAVVFRVAPRAVGRIKSRRHL